MWRGIKKLLAFAAAALLSGTGLAFPGGGAQASDENWTAMEKNFYCTEDFEKENKITLGEELRDLDKRRIFWCGFPTETSVSADCAIQEINAQAGWLTWMRWSPWCRAVSDYPEFFAPAHLADGTQTLAQLEYVSKNDTPVYQASPTGESWDDPFPLPPEISQSLLKLGIEPSKANMEGVWFSNYGFGGYQIKNSDAHETGSPWVLWVRRVDEGAHTAFKPGKVYTQSEVLADLQAHKAEAFPPGTWQSVLDSYYAAAKALEGRPIAKDTESWYESFSKYQIDPTRISALHTMNIGSREDMLHFIDNYRPGHMMADFVRPTGDYMALLLCPLNGEELEPFGGCDLDIDQGWEIKAKNPFQWEQLGAPWDCVPLDPERDALFQSLKRLGFDASKTRACSLKIPFYSTSGILFYDGEKEAYLAAQQNGMIYETGYRLPDEVLPVEDLTALLKRDLFYIVPDENGEYCYIPGYGPNGSVARTAKPVIYLYPQRPTDVDVRLDFGGMLRDTLPLYDTGWRVTAFPDGTLVNRADGKTFPYLFWDGDSDTVWDFSRGYCVAGGDAEPFLREKLAYLGLTAHEAEDFLEYWLPELRANDWNLITFSTDQYAALAPLTVTPRPDSVLRVHMVYKAVDAPVDIAPQTLSPFTRKGFALVEWGGSRA